jgi:hypothetical protein
MAQIQDSLAAPKPCARLTEYLRFLEEELGG